MAEQVFRIVTIGKLGVGFDSFVVEANLMQLCKYGSEKVAQVLSGQRIVLKSGLNRDAANRYLHALASAGLICSIEVLHVSAKATIAAVPAPPTPPPIRTTKQRSTGVQRSFSLGKLTLIAVAVVMICAVGAFGVTQMWRYSGGKWKASQMQEVSARAGFEYVQPPDSPPIQSRKVQLTGAEMQQFNDLLENRQYEVLNTKLEAIQYGFEQDPTHEFIAFQAFVLFSDPYLPHRPLYDEWVAQFPDHYAPYMARAEYFGGMGWESRGGGWARETSSEQFDGMRDYFSLAVADYKKALKLNPQLLAAHIGLIAIHMAQGPKREMNEQINAALQRFPASYQLNKKILQSKEPIWGGDYAQMTEYAHRANQHVAEDPDMSFLYGKAYMAMAWYARRAKQYQKAIDLYTQALSYGHYASLFEARGRVYEKINDLESALNDYQRAIEINPDYTYAYRRIADVLGKRGDFAASLATMEQSQKFTHKRHKFILSWYGSKIQYLLTYNNDALNDFIDSANRYEAAKKARPYLPGMPLKTIPVHHRFQSPSGTKPYGLAWFRGSLYLSSFRDAPGIYQLDPADGRVLKVGVPDIVYEKQYGGLAADSQHLYHLQAYYDRNLHELNPETLVSIDKTYLYTSHFQLSDMALHDQHIYAIGYHLTSNLKDYRLLKFSPDGVLRESFEITPVTGKSMSAGMASDGTWLWVSLGDVLYKMDPATGDVIDGFTLPGQVHCLAWDGANLWGATADGNIFTLAVQP